MRSLLIIPAVFLMLFILAIFLNIRYSLRDRHPGYMADMKIVGEQNGQLSVGFAAFRITPQVKKWENEAIDEANSNEKDSSFEDNYEYSFEPIGLAGFDNGKYAKGIHDDLWARTMVVDDGKTRIALVVLDAIGLMADNIIDIRQMIPAESKINYTIVASTHDHEAPDLMGLWGTSAFSNGVNKEYMKYVKIKAVKSVITAARNLKPARLEISEDLTSAIPLVKDTRMPEVFDSGLRLIKAIDKENGKTLGSLIAWADHAETLWSDNLLITSDFCHYLRKGVEKGVYKGDSLVKPGIGGISVYVNGAVGGLMTTHPSLAVKDPVSGIEYKEPSFKKAEAQGNALSLAVLNAMDKPSEIIDSASISLVVKTIIFPIDNTLFKLAAVLGILDRSTVGWMKMRSEISACKIGPLSFVTIPGEPYPELINGGIEAPEGNDFKIQPLELPVVRDMMPGKYKFVFGLANDEVGYIIPKSQWDAKSPYTYGRKDSPYGEENSLGPETAPILHKNLQYIFDELSGK